MLARQKRHALAAFGTALHEGGVEDDDREGRCTQHVHGLVARAHTLLEHGAREWGFDWADGLGDSRDDQHHDANQQRRREELADDVDDARLAAGEQVDDDEERDGEGREISRRRITEVGGDREFEGRRRRAGHGEQHAQAQDRRRAEDGAARLAKRILEGAARTAHGVDHEHAQAREHGVSEQEADESPGPQAAAELAKRRREYEVAGPEEHREQGEPDDYRVLPEGCAPMSLCVVRIRLLSALAPSSQSVSCWMYTSLRSSLACLGSICPSWAISFTYSSSRARAWAWTSSTAS